MTLYHLAPVTLPAHTTHVGAPSARLTPELVNTPLVRVDPETGGVVVVVTTALAPASHLTPRLLALDTRPSRHKLVKHMNEAFNICHCHNYQISLENFGSLLS